MRMRRKFSLVMTCLLLPLLAGFGWQTPQDAATAAADRCMDTADQLLFKVNSWSELRKWFESYKDCDDGYLAEGVSDYVAVSLAQRWQDLPKLERQIKNNPRFKAFVLQHIDATTDSNDLEAIVEHATKRCPSRSMPLCSSLISTAREALEEVHKIDEPSSRPPDQIDAELRLYRTKLLPR